MNELKALETNQVSGGFSFFSSPPPISDNIIMNVTSSHLYGGAVAIIGFLLGIYVGSFVQKNIDYIGHLEHELNRKN